jgi:hypothetical protein
MCRSNMLTPSSGFCKFRNGTVYIDKLHGGRSWQPKKRGRGTKKEQDKSQLPLNSLAVCLCTISPLYEPGYAMPCTGSLAEEMPSLSMCEFPSGV